MTKSTKRSFSDRYDWRTDGPGEWWFNQMLHREDGPAVEYHTGQVEWWLHGVEYTFDDWFDFVKLFDNLSDEDKTLLKLEWG